MPELVPGCAPIAGGQFDVDSMRLMLRTLLQKRFKLAVHEEAGSVPGYQLVAVKPTLRRADPANRPGCIEGPAAGEKDPRIANPVASRLVTCLNTSVFDFLAELRNRANGYLAQLPSAVDATGLEGKYDITVNFSPIGAAGRGGAGSGAITLFDALETQLGLKLETGKRSGAVMVIDHCEDNPIDN